MTEGKEELVDAADRDGAVHERERNVVVDAGAGSGKTSLVVRRLLALVAPPDGSKPIPLARIAAITFTRRAAGELRFKVREALLAELTGGAASPARRDLLHDALGALDTAYVTTIHGFADRLLRLVPRAAKVSPAYAIADDTDALARETYERLVDAARDGSLARLTGGAVPDARLIEAAEALRLGVAAGVPAESTEHAFATRFGLDALVKDLVSQRDVVRRESPAAKFDRARFTSALDGFLVLADELETDTVGADRIRRVARDLTKLREEADVARLHRRSGQLIDRYLVRPGMRKGAEFGGHKGDWARFNALVKGSSPKAAPPIPALVDELLAPGRRWLATRLLRLAPVTIAAYETVKRERAVLDHVDLLLRLRDLLANDVGVRRKLGALLDHVFVDEFQDTDPLQAEVIVWLCEAEHTAASSWREVQVAPGRLTVVGDPKQSIYRFRRADIALYDEVRSLLLAQGAVSVELRTGFRSVRPLVEWTNEAFEQVLGVSADGRRFDPKSGRVFHRPLTPAREALAGPAVHLVPFDSAQRSADGYRQVEAAAVARYLRWLVRVSGALVCDPHTGEQRPVRYDDVAVLAFSTPQLPRLFAELDEVGVPYAARGGTLFVSSDLSRRFLLGLRAIADPSDGVAQAALLRSPFFALSFSDLALADDHPEHAARRGRAQAVVTELRRERHRVPVGTTARALIERTALGRSVASMSNGAARLAQLYELCLVLEARALDNGWDFDSVTAHARAWVGRPTQLDPPRPLSGETVEVLTVHQAKGLEWPIVVIWDGRAPTRSNASPRALRLDRDGEGWALGLSGLSWEEPEGAGLAETERAYRDAERARLLYVAATRARDRLVLPVAGQSTAKHLLTPLLDGDRAGVVTLPAYGDASTSEDEAWWTVSPSAHSGAAPTGVDRAALLEDLRAGAERASELYWVPRAVSVAAHEAANAASLVPRHGPEFGTVVHFALEAFVRAHSRGAATDLSAHVALALSAHELAPALRELVLPDVVRAVDRMRLEGWLEPSVRLYPELPVAGEGPQGALLNGTIDLLVVSGSDWLVVDFKTDAPPAGAAAVAMPRYAVQVELYRHLLSEASPERAAPRGALLFTADGSLHAL